MSGGSYTLGWPFWKESWQCLWGASKPSIPTDPVISPPSTDTKKMSRDANKGLAMKMLTPIFCREQKIRNNLNVPK